jgi:hypothetical protein
MNSRVRVNRKRKGFKYLRKAHYCEPFSELSQMDAGFMPASKEEIFGKTTSVSDLATI